MSNLSAPYLHDEAAAYDFVESVLWPEGPVCPHCGCVENIKVIPANPEKRVRHGLKRCGDCRKQFTVKVGTVFEASKVKLHLWVRAIVLMTASKKGISAHQMHRTLDVTYKTAWFMCHRIREAMRSGDLAPFGADGGTVEVDETYIGTERKRTSKKQRGGHHKMKVLSLVDRASGRAKSVVVDRVTKGEILPILRENIAEEATIYIDEGKWYALTEILGVCGEREGERAMDGILGTAEIGQGRSIHIATLSRQSVIENHAEHLGFDGYFLFETTDDPNVTGLSILAKALSVDAAFRMLDVWRAGHASA